MKQAVTQVQAAWKRMGKEEQSLSERLPLLVPVGSRIVYAHGSRTYGPVDVIGHRGTNLITRGFNTVSSRHLVRVLIREDQ